MRIEPARKTLERGLLVLGSGCLLLYGAAAAQAWATQAAGFRELAAAKPAANPGNPAPGNTSHDSTPLAPGDLVGHLEIARLRVSTIVLEGTDSGVLRRAVGHVPGTALPAEAGGNVALAGHRDSFFEGLKGVQPGDRVTLTTPAALYLYRVETTEVVGPHEVRVLAPSPEPRLTLITCYPFGYLGRAPQRFIVHARLENVGARS